MRRANKLHQSQCDVCTDVVPFPRNFIDASESLLSQGVTLRSKSNFILHEVAHLSG